jgi:formylglycine-generating enzyme required for sulfatase activity
LPTEAQWEYACRAGTQTAFYFGDEYGKSDDYMWSYGNSDTKTHKVGMKKPNAWGLYDMSGNVWEWCQDWYGNYTVNDKAMKDPLQLQRASENKRVTRGGAWNMGAAFQRSAYRGYYNPNCKELPIIGFRIALVSDNSKSGSSK